MSYEAAYLDGFQGNLYRMVPSAEVRYEYLPEQGGMRNAITPAHRVLPARDRGPGSS